MARTSGRARLNLPVLGCFEKTSGSVQSREIQHRYFFNKPLLGFFFKENKLFQFMAHNLGRFPFLDLGCVQTLSA